MQSDMPFDPKDPTGLNKMMRMLIVTKIILIMNNSIEGRY